MKIVFLDIDDVLNSARTAYANYGYNCPTTVKNGSAVHAFDWTAIRMLTRFQREHGVKFVLSSTWRLTYDHIELGKVLGLDVIDSTPSGNDYQMRGSEIKAWLDEQVAGTIEAYAIIDDDSDMLAEQKGNFIHVPRHNGLTFQNIEQLAQILCVRLI